MDPEKMVGLYVPDDDGRYKKMIMNLETYQVFTMEEWEQFKKERSRQRAIRERLRYERRRCPHEAQFQLYTKFYSK